MSARSFITFGLSSLTIVAMGLIFLADTTNQTSSKSSMTEEQVITTALEFIRNDVKNIREEKLTPEEELLALRRVIAMAEAGYDLSSIDLTEDEFKKFVSKWVELEFK